MPLPATAAAAEKAPTRIVLLLAAAFLLTAVGARWLRPAEAPWALVAPAVAVAALWLAVVWRGPLFRTSLLLLPLLTVAANLLTGAVLPLAAAAGAAVLVQAVVACWLQQRRRGETDEGPALGPLPAGWRLRSTGDLRRLSITAVLSSVVGTAVLEAGVLLVGGHPDLQSWLALVVRNSISILVLVAPVLRQLDPTIHTRPGVSAAAPAERWVMRAAFGAVYLLVFFWNPGLPLDFLALPVSAWYALRRPTTEAARQVVVVAVLVVLASLNGHGPFAGFSPATSVLLAQLFIGLVSITSLLVALHRDERDGLLEEAQSARGAAAQHAALLDTLFTSVSDGLSVFDRRGKALLRNAAAADLFGPSVTDLSNVGWEQHFGLFQLDGSPFGPADVPVRRALRGEEAADVDMLVRTPHRPEGIILNVSAFPLGEGDGVPWSGGAVAAFHDVTAVRRTAAELASTRDLFAGVLDAATEQSIIGIDTEGRVTVWSGGAERILGYPAAEMLGQTAERLHDADEVVARAAELGIEPSLAVFTQLPRHERHETRQWTYRRRDGSTFQGMLTVTAVRAADGEVTGFMGYMVDISQRLAAEQRLADSEQLFRLGFDTAPVSMLMVGLGGRSIAGADADPGLGRLLRVNRALAAFTGLTETELLQSRLADLVETGEGGGTTFLAPLLSGAVEDLHVELQFHHPDGHARWGLLSASVVRPSTGQDPYLICLVEDVTARREAEANLAHQALHDGLTGLPNRTLLHDRLTHALATAARTATSVGVLYLDLDGFKAINDSAGHAAGDEVLRLVTGQLQQAVRPGDTVARLGGDEFAVVCPDVITLDDVQAVADRLLTAVSQPVPLEAGTFPVGASIGLCLSQPTSTAEQLLQDADAAMYRSKRAGKGRTTVHDPEQNARAVRAARLLPELHQALAEEQFVLHGQPVVELAGGRVVAVETLLRWDHPRRGLLAPAEFLDVAEASPLMSALGRSVLLHSCRMAASWVEVLGDRAPAVHVNFSGRQLQSGHLLDDILDALRRTGLPGHRLVVEVTETFVPLIADSLRRDLDRLRLHGVRIAVDDLGTGYSSLARLTDLPVDVLKIDRSFVAGLGIDRGCDAIVRGIVTIGRALGQSIVGEGVETAEQAELLAGYGADLAQGYHFSRPLPADRLIEHLCARTAAGGST